MTERHDVGETDDERDDREAEVKGHGRRELVVVAALVILFIGFAGAKLYDQGEKISRQQEQIEGFATALRDANVRGCERQNEVRASLRERIRQDTADARAEIKQSRRTNPALFPDIPPEKFQQLIDRQVRRSRHRIDSYHDQLESNRPANCEQAHPEII